MDQATLHRIEAQCVQEEPPWCTASCPLHMDARSFCASMAGADWDKAWSYLSRTLPLPTVLARLCHGPCMEKCLRSSRGGALNLPALERFCVEQPVRPARSLPMPIQNKRVCVVGGGLAGLSAASDLIRKGIGVVLYSRSPGLELAEETLLPSGILQMELKRLEKLGVTFQAVMHLTPESLEGLLSDYDAVVIDSSEQDVASLFIGCPDSLTRGTKIPGLFLVGEEREYVFQAASGRSAALSAERFMQGVSMVAGRHREEPYESLLHTSLEGVLEAPPDPVPHGGYSSSQAQAEAKRCIQCECLECVKQCEYLKSFGAYPKVYARQIYNNQSIVMGTRQANALINSCMLCGLCETLCPGNFSMENLCLEARQDMVKLGTMPPSAHEFALRDMDFANGERCAVTRHAPGMTTSTHLFFPGCQLGASRPEAVEQTYKHLCASIPGMGLMLRCCGAPAYWAGQVQRQSQAMEAIAEQWESLGCPVIVCACPSCISLLREALPQAEVLSLWQVLHRHPLPHKENNADKPQKGTASTLEMTIHDPCTARHAADVQADARVLLHSAGVQIHEPDMGAERTQCCGFGGLLAEANPSLGTQVSVARASMLSGELVTYCAMCRDRLVKSGARIQHVLDLLFPDKNGEDMASRPAPGYSRRRENRAHLCERLLQNFWGEKSTTREPYECLSVTFSTEALLKMEQRRILKSDVLKVLAHAQQTGKVLCHDQTGWLRAVYRPVAVTYWVEFEERDEGYFVHNTWCHRMQVLGGAA